jgi:hypothetical protein
VACELSGKGCQEAIVGPFVGGFEVRNVVLFHLGLFLVEVQEPRLILVLFEEELDHIGQHYFGILRSPHQLGDHSPHALLFSSLIYHRHFSAANYRKLLA